MKSFEELEECVKNINEMEDIFKSIVVLGCHQEQIQRHTELKDRVFEILVKDVQRVDALCYEEMAECGTCTQCGREE